MTMLERMAIAIFDTFRVNQTIAWEQTSDVDRNEIRECARAALKAMRELSEADINACHLEPLPRDLMYWQAMIDAALTPPKSP